MNIDATQPKPLFDPADVSRAARMLQDALDVWGGAIARQACRMAEHMAGAVQAFAGDTKSPTYLALVARVSEESELGALELARELRAKDSAEDLAQECERLAALARSVRAAVA